MTTSHLTGEISSGRELRPRYSLPSLNTHSIATPVASRVEREGGVLPVGVSSSLSTRRRGFLVLPCVSLLPPQFSVTAIYALNPGTGLSPVPLRRCCPQDDVTGPRINARKGSPYTISVRTLTEPRCGRTTEKASGGAF